MTLGGLAAAVGLVIDDAIVVVENVALHRDAGQGRLEAIRSALRGNHTSRWSVSTITPIVVFVPLIATTGVTGVFFRALAITVGVSLLTSLALALTLDSHSQPVFHPRTRKGPRQLRLDRENLSDSRAAAGRRRSLHERSAFGRSSISMSAGCASPSTGPRWIAVFAVVLIVASFFCYRALGHRPAAGDG